MTNLTLQDVAIDDLRKIYRQQNNLDPIRAILGLADGTIPDTNKPGNVWVQMPAAGGGLLNARSVRAPANYLALVPGTPIMLEYDHDGILRVRGLDPVTMSATGSDPVAYHQAQGSPSTPQSSIETLSLIAKGGMLVSLKSWNPIVSNRYREVSYPDINLGGSVPSAGDMRYALIAVLADYTDVEVVTSTPRLISDLDLGEADVQECLDALTPNSTPAWAIMLIGGQTTILQSQIDSGVSTKDLRQMVNTAASAITGTATLAAGTVVVATTAVTADSRIFLTAQETGLFAGSLRVSARTAGTAFTILSTVLTDTALVAWMITEP